MLRIAGATVNQTPLDWSHNTRNIVEAIGVARSQHVDILCFPELAITGYGCEDLFLSPWLLAKALDELDKIRDACGSLTVCVGLPVNVQGTTYNGVCVINDRKILGITLKQNLARDGVHYEHRWFEPWKPGKVTTLTLFDEPVPVGDVTYDLHGIRIGFEICEDAWRKDRPGHRLQDRGAQLILNASASHFAMNKSRLREEVVVNGSRMFSCTYLFVNLLGNEAGRMVYDGDIIVAQQGEIKAINRRLSFQPFNVLACDVDFTDPKKTKGIPTTDDKEEKEELARAVSLALFDYLRKSHAQGFVLSLSGGADSSACAIFVAEMVRRASQELGWPAFYKSLALDPEKINGDWKKAVGLLLTCAYQRTKNSSTATLNAAQSLALSLGATFHHWSIDLEVDQYVTTLETAIGRKLTWEQDDISLQNIQARARSPLIWLLANVKRAVLLTTSNRSEGDVGYATMDGDTSGSLAPIAGLTKTFILSWLKWAEKERGYEGLSIINALTPTAELRPPEKAQTDEHDLMPYPILAEIERLAFIDRLSPVEVFQRMAPQHKDQALLKSWIKKFFRLWAVNQWKRERIAPSFHLDEMNVDPKTWCRFPILSNLFAEELNALDAL